MSNKSESRDIFANECCNPIVWTLGAIGLFAQSLPAFWSDLITTLLFFAFGLLCLINHLRCDRYHCIITGVGFLGVGVISLLGLLNVVTLPHGLNWGLFLVVLVVGYSLELRHKLKTGKCYRD